MAAALKHASVTDAQEDFFRQLNAQPSGAQRFTFFFLKRVKASYTGSVPTVERAAELRATVHVYEFFSRALLVQKYKY